MNRARLQMVFGWLNFGCRFLLFDRAMLSSSYASLASVQFLHRVHDKSMISDEMASDVQPIADSIWLEGWSSIVQNSHFDFPGTQDVSLDDSASLTCGWGVHAFGFVSGCNGSLEQA